MRERLLEDWLAKIGERGFEIPFSQVLITRGHRVLYMGHSPIEHGKDIVTRDSKGRLHAYQLKQGSVGLKEWERIRSQVVALVETAIDHPNVGKARFNPYLVISGELSTPARSRISAENKSWEQRGFRPLTLITGKELLADFSALASDFWPVGVPEIQTFLELYQRSGEQLIDKAQYAAFCLSVFTSGRQLKTEVSRRIAAINIFVSYLLSKAYAAENHWAVVEGWTIAASHIAWVAAKHKLDSRLWRAAFDLALAAAFRALEKLKDETLTEKALDPRTIEWDEITRARTTYAIGAVATWFLLQRGSTERAELDHAVALVRQVVRDRRALLWGESAIPFHLLTFRFLGNATSDRLSEAMLLNLITTIANTNGGHSREGLPDPYEDADTILERLVRRTKNAKRRPRMHTGRSYTLEGLVFLAARRLLKVSLEATWASITHVEFVKFVPAQVNDFLLWNSKDGSLNSRQPGRPQSWKALLVTARNPDIQQHLPPILLDRPDFAVLLALVFPHRLTTELMLFIDDSFRLSFGQTHHV